MRLLADECCHGTIVELLRAAGHDVSSVGEANPSELDSDILALAASEKRVLITDDKDFGELAVRDELPTFGVILVRTSSTNPRFEAQRILALIGEYGDRVSAQFSVVENTRFRVRALRSG